MGYGCMWLLSFEYVRIFKVVYTEYESMNVRIRQGFIDDIDNIVGTLR